MSEAVFPYHESAKQHGKRWRFLVGVGNDIAAKKRIVRFGRALRGMGCVEDLCREWSRGCGMTEFV